MKKEFWLVPLVFLGTSIPVVLVLQALDVAGESRLLLAIIVGAVCAGFAQTRLRAKRQEERRP